MVAIAIDYHKRYSITSGRGADGKCLGEHRIEGNQKAGYAAVIQQYGTPCRVVIEAGRNWQHLYEDLEEIEGVREIIVAHPYKVRVIAEAQIKTDRLDARILAELLQKDMIPQIHVPRKETRQRKEVMRQRTFWVGTRTRIRNRIHELIDRYPEFDRPQVSDLFGVKGRAWLQRTNFPEPNGMMIRQDLAVMEELEQQIRETEAVIRRWEEESKELRLVMSIPGIGNILGSVIATEIDQVERFRESQRLCAYAGLVPTTSSSGGKEYHGRLLPRCNKWLRWAFVEAAWVAVGCSSYFGGIYRHYRVKGKGANTAIVVVARRICQIVWHILTENRMYREQPTITQFPGRSQCRLTIR
jgi:transposase